MANSERKTGDWLERWREKKRAEKTAPPKEKKDTSAFGGKQYLRREEAKRWFKRPEMYHLTKLPEKERIKLPEKLFPPKEYGQFIEKGEPERVLRELEKGKWGEFKNLSPIEREKYIRTVKKFLGE